MTFLAVVAEQACMDFRFQMAIRAAPGNTSETVFILSGGVTRDALNVLMGTHQWKFGLFVIEIHHAVDTIMAFDAAQSKFIHMRRHEPAVIARMAGKTYLVDI